MKPWICVISDRAGEIISTRNFASRGAAQRHAERRMRIYGWHAHSESDLTAYDHGTGLGARVYR